MTRVDALEISNLAWHMICSPRTHLRGRMGVEIVNPEIWKGLVGAWLPSLGDTGPTLRDVSGNGSHGPLVQSSFSMDNQNPKAFGSSLDMRVDTSHVL